jgi:aryl-alcohol dehydrogenase-like predicted oxidoreductase
MRQVRLGQTDLKVSAIAFGTWASGGDWGAADLKESTDAIHHALELGINLFDTAQGYGFGAAEELLGSAVGPGSPRGRRHRYQGRASHARRPPAARRQPPLAARRCPVQPARPGHRLHRPLPGPWPDLHTPPAETAGALAELVAEGKIRHEIEERILPYTAAHDIGVLVYGPMAHGLLSGRMTPFTSFDPDDRRAKSPDFVGETLRRNLAVVERLEGFARERGITLPQLAVAWTLANPAVQVAIVGARRPAQLDGTAPAADIELSAAELAEIDTIVADAAPVWGPHPEGM